MKGRLVINAYLRQPKYEEIHALLYDAFVQEGISLDVKTNAGLMNEQTWFDGGKVDFILFWDKDIVLAKRLERAGYKLYNSSFTIEACDDKGRIAALMEGSGIKTPRTLIAPFCYDNIGYRGNYDFLKEAADILGFPMVVKESKGSFGQQVWLVNNYDQLLERVKSIEPRPFIMQQFISSSYGRDVRVQVVGGEVVASVLRQNPGDFRANVTSGGTMTPYKINGQWEQVALKAAKIFRADFAGVDILFGENDEPVFCEINSNAHFKNLLDATGINAAQHLARHIKRDLS